MATTKKILIEGIGGVGGYVAFSLCKQDFNLALVTGNEKITEAINKNGIQVIEDEEITSVEALAYTELSDLPDTEYDMAFLIMKADATLEAAENTVPYLNENGFVVTFQNGIIEDRVMEKIGEDKVVSVIIGWGGTMREPGIYEKTSPGEIHLGELDGSMTQRIDELSDILTNVSPVVVTDNIRGALWSKLAINSCINSIGVLTGQKLGVMMKNGDIRELFLKIYQEVVDTAHALDIRLEEIAANPYLLYRSKDSNFLSSWIKKNIIMRIVGRKYSEIKSSSLQSIERGRRSEVDYLNGYVVDKANEVGISVPANELIVELIHQIEEGNRKIHPNNIDEFKKMLNN